MVILLRAVPSFTPGSDYQRAFYAAGAAVLEHQSPYGSALHQLETKINSPSLTPNQRARTYIPYLYPPPYALLLAIVSTLPYDLAARVFYWINIAALVLVALIIGYTVGSRRRRFLASAVVFAALVGFTPIRSALALGQADLVVLVLATAGLALCGSLVAEQKSVEPWRAVLAGALLGAAAVIKIYPVVILVVMLVRRQYRLVSASLATIAVLVALAVVVSGPRILLDYLHATQLAADPRVVAFPFSFGVMAFAYRSLTATPYATPLVALSPVLISGLVLLVAVVVAGLGIAFILAQRRIDARHLVLAVATALAFFPILEPQHLALLMAVLPGMVLVTVGGTQILRRASTRLAVATAGASLGLAWVGLWAGDRAMVVLTVFFAGAIGTAAIVLLRRHGWLGRLVWGAGLISSAFVLMGSPALLQVSARWGVPMSQLHVLLGEAQLYSLLMLIAGVLLVEWGLSQMPYDD